LGSIDIDTNQLTALFHPRQQQWTEHFRLSGAEIIPLSAEGRVTAFLLKFNHPERLEERQNLIASGQFFKVLTPICVNSMHLQTVPD
jgi:hypothetical protein